jgi:hypothetical protein
MIIKKPIWTWIVPVKETAAEEPSLWKEHGGKWLIYGDLDEMERLSTHLNQFVEQGKIVSAKFWNASSASAMCVYSLEGDNKKTKKILTDLRFKPTAWEYDYARKKNWTRPRFFLSAFYKLRILLKTFGVKGTLKFIVGAYT